MARNSLSDAMKEVEKAVTGAEALVDKAVSEEAKEELTALVFSLKALGCVLLTCRNFIEYEEILAQRGSCDEEVSGRTPDYGTGIINRGSYELRLVARSEMDNARTLAKLIETSPRPVLGMTASPETEDALNLGPDMVEHLRKKARVMMARWPEYNVTYPSLPLVHARQATRHGDRRPGVPEERVE